MMLVIGILLELGAVTLLLARRHRRFLLSATSLAGLGVWLVLAIVQGAATGAIRLDDELATALYVAIPVWAGAFGGVVEGFVVPVLGSGPLLVIALLLGHDAIGTGADTAQTVAQGAIAAVVLGLIGVAAGLLRRWPAAPAGAVALWPLFLLAVHADALRGLPAWIATFAAAGLALAGLAVVGILRTMTATGRVPRSEPPGA